MPHPFAPDIIAVVVKGYPRLSETFITQELLALERLGLRLHIYSLRQPYDQHTHPMHGEIAAPVTYLPEYLWREPAWIARTWAAARRLPGYPAAWSMFWRDLRRDRTPNRVRRFGQACVLASEITPQTSWLYAHFLHTPASVARYAATMLQLPFAISAHAKDIWTTPDWEKREKLADCAWLTTCTRTGAEHLGSLAPAPGIVDLTYHGLDLARFPPRPAPLSMGDGSDPSGRVQLLSVGRLVEKKGYADLLIALADLPANLHWQFTHIGGGPLKATLQAQAQSLGVADRITWMGPQAQEAVLQQLRATDLFVLASRIAADGDRDGLPNVLLEAQSQAVPCIATDVSGIPELIEPDRTGQLVEPGDPQALSRALATLIRDPARRHTLGQAGEARVRQHFAMSSGITAIAAKFGAVAAAAQ